MNNAVNAPAKSPTWTCATIDPIEHACLLGPAGSKLITARSDQMLHYDAEYMSEHRFRSSSSLDGEEASIYVQRLSRGCESWTGIDCGGELDRSSRCTSLLVQVQIRFRLAQGALLIFFRPTASWIVATACFAPSEVSRRACGRLGDHVSRLAQVCSHATAGDQAYPSRVRRRSHSVASLVAMLRHRYQVDARSAEVPLR